MPGSFLDAFMGFERGWRAFILQLLLPPPMAWPFVLLAGAVFLWVLIYGFRLTRALPDELVSAEGDAKAVLSKMARLPHVDPSGIVYEVLAARTEHVRRLQGLPNVCMLLGLMGTVAGITQIVPGIEHVLGRIADTTVGGLDANGIRSVFNEPLIGFRSAFSSTFYGLSFSLLVFWKVSRITAYVSEQVDMRARRLLGEVAPSVLDPDPMKRLDASLNKLSGVLDETPGALDKVRDTFDGIANRIGGTADDFQKTANVFAQHVQEFQKAIDGAAGSFRNAAEKIQSVHEALSNNLEELSKVREGITTGLDEVKQEFRQVFKDFIQKTTEVREKLDDTATRILGGLERAGEEYLEGLHVVTTAIHYASSKFEVAGEEFREAGKCFNRAALDIGNQAYKVLADRLDPVVDMAGRFSDATENVERAIRDLIARTNPNAVQPDRWEELIAAVNRTGENTARTPDGSDHSELSNVAAELREVVRNLRSLSEQLIQLRTPVPASADGLHDDVKRLVNIQEISLRRLEEVVRHQGVLAEEIRESRTGVLQRMWRTLGRIVRRRP
ncbi:MAG: WXG100 family type VII secretion target [Chthonomonadales bacterium]